VKFNFPASNNEAEYEALIAGLQAVRALSVRNLRIKCDSQLIVNQTTGEYETRDERMIKYQALVREELAKLAKYEIEQIPRADNSQADALANLGSTLKLEYRKVIPIEIQEQPSIDCLHILSLTGGPTTWMNPIIRHLRDQWQPEDKFQARKLRQRAARYWLNQGQLYRKSFQGPSLKCLAKPETTAILQEIHEGI